MTEPLLRALNRMRGVILDPDQLVAAVASGRQKGQTPRWRRVELRYVDLKAGRRLQITAYDDTQAFTANHEPDAARDAVDDLLDEPFGSWHVDTPTHTHAIQVTRRLEAIVHTHERSVPSPDPELGGELEDHTASADRPDHSHDREKQRLLAQDDPVFRELGLADAEGRMKPSRQAKYRQVEEFLRLLDGALTEAIKQGHVRRPTTEDPLRIADLGCGNAYLTFAAQRFLTSERKLPVVVTGVDVKEQSREHNSGVAERLGVAAEFVVGSIAGVQLDPPPEVVLALHACDTATDEALARGVEWGAGLVLAAPCCHHDIAAQLRRSPTPPPYALLTRHGILRERLADTLTDGLRASLMRLQGYRVDVVQFVESQHTPRNTMLRATRTGKPVKGGGVKAEYDDLVATWSLRPRLAELLGVAGPADA